MLRSREVRKTGLTAQASEALKMPVVVARASVTNPLEALNRNPSGSSLEDMKDLLEKAQKSEPSPNFRFMG